MKFKEIVERNFNEWKSKGICQEAVELNEKIAYFDTAFPGFFTGKIDAELVLVHLNPKRNKNLWNQKCVFPNFQNYWEHATHFGKITYGENSSKTHSSPFDQKQVRFLEPFGILPFNGEKYHDLEVVIDQKLQLELVPFGSPDFNYDVIGEENLKPYVLPLLDIILEHERKYLIFCGRVFEKILRDFIVEEKRHSFKLIKIDGKKTQNDFEVINIKLKHNDKEITACIAPQFALQGCPIDKYGEAVHDLYGNFDSKPKIKLNNSYQLINKKK